MLDIQRVLKQDRLLRAMTGLNRKAFEARLETFSRLYEAVRQQQPRQRAVGRLAKSASAPPPKAAVFHLVLLQVRSHL